MAIKIPTTPPLSGAALVNAANSGLASDAGSPKQSFVAAATVDIGSVDSVNIEITGNTTISSFGASVQLLADQFKWVRFTGTPVITFNATSLITPTGRDMQIHAGDLLLLQYGGSGNWRVANYFQGATREVLIANRTYFVRTDGLDTNNGLTNSSAGAFLTIQKAISVVTQTIDTAGFVVTISVQAGTYTGAAVLNKPIFGGGSLTLSGDTTTPSNVFINSAASCISVLGTGIVLTLQGFKLASSTGDAINCQFGGRVVVGGNMEFGACPASSHCHGVYGGIIDLSGVSYLITGSSLFHYWGEVAGSLVRAIGTATVTISGGLTFTTFAKADNLSGIDCLGQTFTANPTCQRFNMVNNGVIGTFGGGVNYFPGTVAGPASPTASGGIYF